MLSLTTVKELREMQNKVSTPSVSSPHFRKMGTETAHALPSRYIAERLPERPENDVSRKHQEVVLKNLKPTRVADSKRTLTGENRRTTSGKHRKKKALSVCKDEEVEDQNHPVCDNAAGKARFRKLRAVGNTAPLKPKTNKKNKKDTLTESSVPAKRRKKQVGTEAVKAKKRTCCQEELEPDEIATITKQNACVVSSLEERNREQKESCAKAAAGRMTNQSTENAETEAKKQNLNAVTTIVPSGKPLFPDLSLKHMLSEISRDVKGARDFVHKISVDQNNLTACLQSQYGRCAQTNQSNLPLDEQYMRTISEDRAFVADNYFNRSIKTAKHAVAGDFCQNVEKLVKDIFDLMKNVERSKYWLLHAIKIETGKHEHMEIQQRIIDTSKKARNSLRQVAQLCLQLKQMVTYLDFFSEELKPDSLITFCTSKEGISSSSSDRNIYDEFEHMEIANESPFGQQSCTPIVIIPKVSSVKCQLAWTYPVDVTYKLSELMCTLEVWNGIELSYHLIPVQQTTYSVALEPGRKFQIKLTLFEGQGRVLAFGELAGKAEFSAEELRSIYEKALTFVGQEKLKKFSVLHRCNPVEAFREIKNDGNIMRKHRKDSNGHSASSINHRLKGLFFYGHWEKGHLPEESPFGNRRLDVSSFELLDPQKTNLYFADFYCNKNKTRHFVTIVACKKGSEADELCCSNLIELNANTNKFVRIIGRSTYMLMRKVRVELFFTEDVDISGRARPKFVRATGRGKALPDGLPHDQSCRKCNLYPLAKESKLNEITQEVYLSARSMATEYKAASCENADLFFHVSALGMALRLFNGIRASCFQSEKASVGSFATSEELQQAGQMLHELGERLLESLQTRLTGSLNTLDQSLSDHFATFERVGHEIRSRTEVLDGADDEEGRNQLARLSVSSKP